MDALALAEAIQQQVIEKASLLQAERWEAMRVQAQEEWRRKRKERARKRALRQGQGMPLAREPSYDPHWHIKQYLTQQHQAEAQSQEQEPASPWQASTAWLKRLSL